jgi:HEAT repeat protein
LSRSLRCGHRENREAAFLSVISSDLWTIRTGTYGGTADALRKIGDKNALKPLLRLTRDNDEHVRKAAKEAMEKIQARNVNKLTE